MPLVTITVLKPHPARFTSAVLDAVHQGLIGAGVPETDRFQRLLALSDDEFRYDETAWENWSFGGGRLLHA